MLSIPGIFLGYCCKRVLSGRVQQLAGQMFCEARQALTRSPRGPLDSGTLLHMWQLKHVNPMILPRTKRNAECHHVTKSLFASLQFLTSVYVELEELWPTMSMSNTPEWHTFDRYLCVIFSFGSFISSFPFNRDKTMDGYRKTVCVFWSNNQWKYNVIHVSDH